MLNLLPIKWILMAFALYCGALTIWIIYSGALTGSTLHDASYLASKLIGATTALTIGVYLLWRFVKPFQLYVFPKLGGKWSGHIAFIDGNGPAQKDATLIIRQNLAGMSLVLESEESVSQTLVVSPQKDDTGTQYSLYYVFQNVRKPQYCVLGRPSTYRGVAIIRFDEALRRLDGQYFTEQSTRGNIQFKLVKSSWL